MTLRRIARHAATLGLVLVPSRVWAEEMPHVAFVLDVSCSDVAGASGAETTRKLFALEMDALLVEPGADVTTVVVKCTGTNAAVSVVDPITRKTVAREVTLAGFPPAARARAMAIAAAELVAASWAEAAMKAPEIPPAVPPPARAREDRAVVSERARAHLEAPVTVAVPDTHHAFGAGILLRALPSEVAQIGGVLRYETDLGALRKEGRWMAGAALDVGASHGRASTALGKVDADTFDAGGELQIAWRVAMAFALRGGLGLRVGRTELVGRSNDVAAVSSGSVHGMWTAPHAMLAARLMPLGALVFEANLEGGDVLAGPKGDVVTADATKHVAFRGGYVASSLWAGAQF